jgi:hypothetical protein
MPRIRKKITAENTEDAEKQITTKARKSENTKIFNKTTD